MEELKQKLKEKLNFLVGSKTFWVSAVGVGAVILRNSGVEIDQQVVLNIIDGTLVLILGRRMTQAALYKPETKND